MDGQHVGLCNKLFHPVCVPVCVCVCVCVCVWLLQPSALVHHNLFDGSSLAHFYPTHAIYLHIYMYMYFAQKLMLSSI